MNVAIFYSEFFQYLNQNALIVARGAIVNAIIYASSRRAKLGQIQGGGVAEGQLSFDKGGVAIIVYFLRIKNITF